MSTGGCPTTCAPRSKRRNSACVKCVYPFGLWSLKPHVSVYVCKYVRPRVMRTTGGWLATATGPRTQVQCRDWPGRKRCSDPCTHTHTTLCPAFSKVLRYWPGALVALRTCKVWSRPLFQDLDSVACGPCDTLLVSREWLRCGCKEVVNCTGDCVRCVVDSAKLVWALARRRRRGRSLLIPMIGCAAARTVSFS